MRTKIALGAIVAVILVLVTAGITAASATSKSTTNTTSTPATKVIDLTARALQGGDVDEPPKGPSVADYFVFSETLTRRSDGRRVGESGGNCQVTRLGANQEPAALHCVATLRLRQGQITVQGLITESGPTFYVAITGGTGAYQTAHGQMRVIRRGDVARYTVYVIL